MTATLDAVVYDICKTCDHFVDENDVEPIPGLDIAQHIHLTSDDHPWIEDHDAEPRGEPKPLAQWKQDRPDLFRRHPDAIGPNSVYHQHPNVTPEAQLANLDALYHDHLPEGTNCPDCGRQHAAINPSSLRD